MLKIFISAAVGEGWSVKSTRVMTNVWGKFGHCWAPLTTMLTLGLVAWIGSKTHELGKNIECGQHAGGVLLVQISWQMGCQLTRL